MSNDCRKSAASPQFTLQSLFVVTAVVALGLGLIVSALGQEREWARLSGCQNTLKQLALAIHNYHDDHHGPWPNYPDASGRPAHSWRTIILPYMCGMYTYNRYRFDEPWDGPNNRHLLPDHLPVDYYSCPADAASRSNFMTSYLAVVGPETMWPRQRDVRLQDITDGASNSIMLVETLSSGIYWPEPRDLEWDQMEMRIGATPGKGISSGHRGGANVAMADGSVRALRADLDPQTLAALLTIRGGEQVDLP